MAITSVYNGYPRRVSECRFRPKITSVLWVPGITYICLNIYQLHRGLDTGGPRLLRHK